MSANWLASTFYWTDPYTFTSKWSDPDPVQNRTGSATLLSEVYEYLLENKDNIRRGYLGKVLEKKFIRETKEENERETGTRKAKKNIGRRIVKCKRRGGV
jgi:hypothetical protein